MNEADSTSFWRKEIPLWRKPKPRDDEPIASIDPEPSDDETLAPRASEPAGRLGGSQAVDDKEDFFSSGLRTRLGPGGLSENGEPPEAPEPDASAEGAAEPWDDVVPAPPRAEQLPPTLAATPEDEVRMHQLIAALAERDATLIELGAQLDERQAQLEETEARLGQLELRLTEEQAAVDDRAEQPDRLDAGDPFSLLEQAGPVEEERGALQPAIDETSAEEARPTPTPGGGRAPETLERLVSEMAQMLGDDPAGRTLPRDSAPEPAGDPGVEAEATVPDGGAGRLPDLRQGPSWRIEHGQQQQAGSSLALVVSYGEGLELRFTGQSALFVERLLRATEQLQALGEMLRPGGDGQEGVQPHAIPKSAAGDAGADGSRRPG